MDTNPPPPLFATLIVHHFESDSDTYSHMISSDLDPFPLYEYSIKEEPLIEYSLSPWGPPQDHDQSIIPPFECDHHGKPTCASPSHHSPFPTNHNLV